MRLSTLNIAWRNLGRNRKRTLFCVSAIAMAQFIVLFINCLMAGMFDDMLGIIMGPLVGHVQVHHKDWRDEQAIDLYIDNVSEAKARIEALPEVRNVSARIYSGVLVAPGEKTAEPADAEPGMVLGVNANTENREGGILESLPQELLPGDGRVAVGKVLAKRLGVKAGTKIAVIGQDADEVPVADLFAVSAVIGGVTEIVNNMGIVMSMADAGGFLAMRDQAHEIVVHGTDHEKAGELATAIRALPALKGAEVLPWREAAPELVIIVDMKDWIDYFFLVIVFAAAAAGIANTMVMSSYERTPEFGMLLAVGSRPGRIVRMVLIEAILLGVVGVAVGSAVGAALVLVTSHTGINYAWLTGISTGETEIGYMGINLSLVIYPKLEFRHVGSGVVAVILTAVVTSVWPAASAARLEPVEAMRS